MPAMTADQIVDVLAAHAKWCRGEAGGKRAVLRSAVLSGADLRSAVLSGADLSGAVLGGADLSGAVLSGAVLRSAVLRSAVLSGADLSSAVLSGAVLRSAVLRSADLSGADLSGADLSGADLRSADLSGAVLGGADLKNLVGGDLALALTEILPREGEVVGWKKCRGGVLVKVKVPADTKRSNATGRKCRAERVEVLEVVGADVGVSMHDGKTKYQAGETVAADGWGGDRLVECDKGIHFWLTREEAEAWTG